MSELPRGWAWTAFGDIAETQLGKMLSAKARTVNGGRPYLRNKNVQWGRIDLDDVLHMDFTDAEFEKFRLSAGDLLVCEGGEVGRAAIWRGAIGDCAFQKALHRVRPRGGVVPEYLLYLLMHYAHTRAFEHYVTGSTIAHLPQEDLRRLPVPLPPLAEQKRIVAAIEERLSRLEAGTSQIELAARRLRTLRSRIVDTAISGPWQERSFGDLILTLRNGVFVSRPAVEPPGVPIFRISAVRPMALAVDDIRYASASETYPEQSYVHQGDLLFTRYSGNPAYVGACAVVPLLAHKTLHPDKLIRVTVDRGRCLPEYIEIAFASSAVRREVEARLKTTAGQVGIAGGQLRTVPLPLPPLAVQLQIVANVGGGLSAADALSAALQRANVRAEALRRSILARAFRGELVAKDPDDEPARVLLERIAAGRDAALASARKRRMKTSA